MVELSIKDKLTLVKTRLSSLDRNLSEEQLDFILHPLNEPCYLKACPGSGKTEVVGIKAAYEISAWEQKFSGIAVLSFTRNAAKEIADRVKKYGGANASQHPHFIGTIDSWLHGYIFHPFAHKVFGYAGRGSDKSYRLVDNEERYDFLSSFKTVFSYTPFKAVWVNDYYFECTNPVGIQSQSRTLDLSAVSATNNNLLEKNKKKFLKAGLATYADAEFLCYYLLKNNETILKNVVKRFPIIIIDECQDLSCNQLEILDQLNQKGTVIHFIGDNNQAIYEFKKVYVDKINSYIDANNFTKKLLTKNFRSNQKIVNVSIELEKYNTGNAAISVVGNEEERVTKCCILWEYTADEFPQLPQKFIDYINQLNRDVADPDLKIEITKSGILARAHKTLLNFQGHSNSELKKIELFANGLNCWANNPRTGQDIQNALQQIGKSISMLAYNGKGNHQHQYCPENYNQIEWRNQLSDLIAKAMDSSTGLFPFTTHTWSQWCANLKPFLQTYWANFRLPKNDWDKVKESVKAPPKKATKVISETLNAGQTKYAEKIRMTTFHDVKGETLDAVLIVSSPNKKGPKTGSYFEDWLGGSGEKEHIRFAYVASSRPKHLLIWAVPTISDNEIKERILELGFELE